MIILLCLIHLNLCLWAFGYSLWAFYLSCYLFILFICGLGKPNENLTTASHNNLFYVSNYVVIQHAHVILSDTNDVCATQYQEKL